MSAAVLGEGGYPVGVSISHIIIEAAVAHAVCKGGGEHTCAGTGLPKLGWVGGSPRTLQQGPGDLGSGIKRRCGHGTAGRAVGTVGAACHFFGIPPPPPVTPVSIAHETSESGCIVAYSE